MALETDWSVAFVGKLISLPSFVKVTKVSCNLKLLLPYWLLNLVTSVDYRYFVLYFLLTSFMPRANFLLSFF